jgi:hypothetical protein
VITPKARFNSVLWARLSVLLILIAPNNAQICRVRSIAAKCSFSLPAKPWLLASTLARARSKTPLLLFSRRLENISAFISMPAKSRIFQQSTS